MDEPIVTSQESVETGRRAEHERNVLTAARGAGITFVGKVVNNLLSLGFVFLLARWLGAEQYGLYRLAVTVVVIVSGACMLGMDAGIKRYIAIARKQHNKELIKGVVQVGIGIPGFVSLVLSLVILLAADPICTRLFNSPDLVPVLRMCTLAIPILVLAQSFSCIAMAYKRVEYDAYTQDIGMEAIKVVLSFAGIMLGFGITAVTVAYVLAAVIALIPLVYLVHRLFPLRGIFEPAERNTREILGFSFPIFLSTMVNQFGRRLETLVLGMFSIVANVGIYSAMLSISSIGSIANIALRGIATPIIAELHSQGKIEDLRKFYQTITKWAMTFNLPVFLVILLFNENLLRILSPEFAVGAFGLIVLAFGNLFDASTGVCGIMISFTGHSKVTLYNSLAYLGASIILDLWFIPTWGLIGAAWAGSLTIIIVNSLRLVQVYLMIDRTSPFDRSSLKPLAAFVISGGVTYLLRMIVLVDHPLIQCVVLSIVMVALYAYVIFKLKLSHEDKLVVERILKGGFMKRRQQKSRQEAGADGPDGQDNRE